MTIRKETLNETIYSDSYSRSFGPGSLRLQHTPFI